jgi:hypothetical protein
MLSWSPTASVDASIRGPESSPVSLAFDCAHVILPLFSDLKGSGDTVVGERFHILREEVRHHRRCRCPFLLGQQRYSPRTDILRACIIWIDMFSLHFGIKLVAVVVIAAKSVAVFVVIIGAVTGVNACITPGGVNTFLSIIICF